MFMRREKRGCMGLLLLKPLAIMNFPCSGVGTVIEKEKMGGGVMPLLAIGDRF